MSRFRSWSVCRRLFSTRQIAQHDAGGDALRQLMRQIAFPVVVVSTAAAPPPHRGPPHIALDPQQQPPHYRFATLSSFTSVSLSPSTVSFALRCPSRWSQLVSAAQHERASDSTRPHFHLHVLSHKQHHLSTLFALPHAQDAPPTRDTVHHAFSSAAAHGDGDALRVQWIDGIPLIRDCLGVLACRIVHQVKVADHDVFFAQVLRAIHNDNDITPDTATAQDRRPLLYINRRYTTVGDQAYLDADAGDLPAQKK